MYKEEFGERLQYSNTKWDFVAVVLQVAHLVECTAHVQRPFASISLFPYFPVTMWLLLSNKGSKAPQRIFKK